MTADASTQPTTTAEAFRRDYTALVTRALTRYVEAGHDLQLETIRPDAPDHDRADIVFRVDASMFHTLVRELQDQEWRADGQ
ncbi:MAG: hypothetical protein GEU80_12205 [Dehalococcoidia bacterium]|nr:hypothetical protein [Dehalococcoidia bacterium]